MRLLPRPLLGDLCVTFLVLRCPVWTWGDGQGEGHPRTQLTRDQDRWRLRFFTLSEGRGRFGRLRPKPVSNCVGSSAQPTMGYAKVSPGAEAWGERSSDRSLTRHHRPFARSPMRDHCKNPRSGCAVPVPSKGRVSSPSPETFAKPPWPLDARSTLSPSSGGEGWGKGTSGHPTTDSAETFPGQSASILTPSPRGRGLGRGSSAQPSLGFAKVSLQGEAGSAVFGRNR